MPQKMDIKTITEYLNAIKRTCLFCNSNKELADKIGVPSLNNNNNFDKVGQDKRIATFEQFNNEYQECSKSMEVELAGFMEKYKETSLFYNNNELATNKAISTKEAILDIIGCLFFEQELPQDKKVSRFISTIYDYEEDDILLKKNVNIFLLLLLLYKVIPTYSSKSGTASDIRLDYAKVKELSSECYDRFGVTDDMAMLDIFKKKIREGEKDERLPSRMELITLFESVINNIYNTSNTGSLLNLYRYFDIEGLWVDGLNKDLVYMIEENNPYYQMTVYHLGLTEGTYTTYALVIYERSDRRLLLETTHPRGRARVVMGEKVGSLDTSSHYVEFDNEDNPKEIRLEDILRHNNYDFNVSTLFRASQEQEDELIQRLESLELKDKFEKYQAEYIPDSDIYAITREFIYISTPNLENGELYRVPRDRYSDKGILSINIDDSCGECVIAQEGPYLAFEKIGLYIDIRTEEKMVEKGIERVKPNEII